MTDPLALFPETYELSRERFRQNLETIRKRWRGATLSHQQISADEDLSIDWIRADALGKNEKVVIFTTGEHGIEGYVGSAMLQHFIDEYLPRLDPQTTGLLLVHAINPWGMKYHRRVNANNVDLNRNFLWDANFDPAFNPEYDSIKSAYDSEKPIQSFALSNLAFYASSLRFLAQQSFAKLNHTFLIGQYRNPKGLHYGSHKYEEETLLLIKLY